LEGSRWATLSGAADLLLCQENAKPDGKDNGEIEYNKCTTAIFTGDIRKVPNIPQPNG
jgi:hypothetical protein